MSVFVLASAVAACGGDSSGGGDAPDASPRPQPDGGGSSPDAGEAADRASYVDQLTIPVGGDDGFDCCKDFGAISENDGIDNAFAALASGLSAFGFDLQATLDAQIQEGDLVVLWNHLAVASASETFTLEGLVGSFEGSTTYETASAGDGSFTVDPLSYDESGDALISFEGAALQSGAMSAGPGTFRIQLPFSTELIEVAVQAVELTGSATLSGGGVAYDSGTLAGYVALEDLFNAFNTFATSEACSCLEFEQQGDVFTQTSDGTWEATNCGNASACTAEDEQACDTLAGEGPICNSIAGVLTNNADIDLDDDASAYEALSIGLEWTAAPAEIAE